MLRANAGFGRCDSGRVLGDPEPAVAAGPVTVGSPEGRTFPRLGGVEPLGDGGGPEEEEGGPEKVASVFASIASDSMAAWMVSNDRLRRFS